MRRMTKKKTPIAVEIFTLDAVSAYLKAGKRTVYRLVQAGDIPAFKVGGTWRFQRSELDHWIASEIASVAYKKSPER
jgi:excisionase family DNA binding protein